MHALVVILTCNYLTCRMFLVFNPLHADATYSVLLESAVSRIGSGIGGAATHVTHMSLWRLAPSIKFPLAQCSSTISYIDTVLSLDSS